MEIFWSLATGDMLELHEELAKAAVHKLLNRLDLVIRTHWNYKCGPQILVELR